MTNALKMAMSQTVEPQVRKLTGEDVKAILKAELKRRGLTYGDLVERLAERGIVESEVNLRNKISRGAFTAAFFVQCLLAIGCEQVSIQNPNK
jgi:anaerobic selenocysteine-containing dehydrogenase